VVRRPAVGMAAWEAGGSEGIWATVAMDAVDGAQVGRRDKRRN
jgi:hypothetical protein